MTSPLRLPRRVPRAARTVPSLAAALALSAAACSPPDARARSAVAERDALRREVLGMRRLAVALDGGRAPGGDATAGLVLGDDDVVVVVRDSLVRALIAAALPITARVGDRAEVRLERATTVLDANVARVTLVGTVRQLGWPHAGAAVRLGGAVADFTVDSTSTLRAKLSLDEVVVGQPTGVPAPTRRWAQAALQRVVDGGLPQLAATLPAIALPVRLDQVIDLPGFGPDGPLDVPAVRANVRVTVRHVATLDGRTWIVLRLARDRFVPVRPAARVAKVAKVATTRRAGGVVTAR